MTASPPEPARPTGRTILRLACAALALAPVAACAVPTPTPTPTSTPAPAATPTPEPALTPQGKTAPSFFDPFDRLDTGRWYISDGWVNGDHQACSWSRDNVSAAGGILRLILRRDPDKLRSHRCAEIRTHAAHGYGTYEVRLRSAAGSGLNTAMFTYSGPPMTKVHDEIDFEFLGINPLQVQLNYFVGARGGNEKSVGTGADLSAGFNTYAFEWLPGSTRWFINGKLVRSEAGAPQPVVPGQFFFSLWSGASSLDGWLGRFDPAAGPVAAEIDWVGYTRPGERCRFAESVTCP